MLHCNLIIIAVLVYVLPVCNSVLYLLVHLCVWLPCSIISQQSVRLLAIACCMPPLLLSLCRTSCIKASGSCPKRTQTNQI